MIRFRLPPSAYIVTLPAGDAVVAPPGYALRYSDGTVYRDGTCPRTSGAEYGPRAHAFRFKSHRAAARVAALCNWGRSGDHPAFAMVERVTATPSVRTR
jgi:hypothetical protein